MVNPFNMEELAAKARKAVWTLVVGLLSFFAREVYEGIKNEQKDLKAKQDKVDDALNGDYGIKERLSNVEGAIHYSREKNKGRATQ